MDLGLPTTILLLQDMHYQGFSSGWECIGVLLIDGQILTVDKNQLFNLDIAIIFVMPHEEDNFRYIISLLLCCYQRSCNQFSLLHEAAGFCSSF